jgi:FkbH-like protein
MKLIEALEVLKQSPHPQSGVLDVHLACGFTPLHFLTFLHAHLRHLFPDQKVLIETGLYGDLPGNLERLEKEHPSAVVVVIEWADLDPRLGIRRLGGWGPRQLSDMVRGARDQAAGLYATLEGIGRNNAITLALPTLPLPPVAFTPGWQSSSFENDLRELVASFCARLSRLSGVRIVSPQRLDQISPPGSRFDIRSELRTGFPYTLSHADALAGLIARIVRNPLPKKGLITDLDETLWKGILGEVNVEGIAWDLDHHAQINGLYQQLLASLAEAGVLVAIASKNDPALVEEAFRKANPILSRTQIFPMEVSWGPKSESVSKILRVWNVGAECVVFVDDSPLELAEVKVAHPEIECLAFPRDDDAAAYQLLGALRDLFGKQSISAEDTIRLESIRASHAVAEAAGSQGDSAERFLQEVGGQLTLKFSKHDPDPRALELINKTNQFNLNGKRHTEASWKDYLKDPNVFLLLASYEDKFGPLGKIAVMAGRQEGNRIAVDHWVMSCRAFSRRIEHGCLLHVFRKFGAEEAVFNFVATPRNGPIRDFFAEIMGAVPTGGFLISKQQLFDRCPAVYLRIQEHVDE